MNNTEKLSFIHFITFSLLVYLIRSWRYSF